MKRPPSLLERAERVINLQEKKSPLGKIALLRARQQFMSYAEQELGVTVAAGEVGSSGVVLDFNMVAMPDGSVLHIDSLAANVVEESSQANVAA